MLGSSDFNRNKRRVSKLSTTRTVAAGQVVPKLPGAGLLPEDRSGRFGWSEPDEIEITEEGSDTLSEDAPQEAKKDEAADAGAPEQEKEVAVFVTRYGSEELAQMAKDGYALPDGAFAIKSEDDLKNALADFQRLTGGDLFTKAGEADARAHIILFARRLGKTEMLPADWKIAKRDYIDERRQDLADVGKALTDGSFPIATVADLETAIANVGKSTDQATAKAHITAQAQALGATERLPSDWPGSTKKAAAPNLRKLMELLEPQIQTPEMPFAVVKSENTQRYSLGIAYPGSRLVGGTPDRVDVHGEYSTPDELEKAAWAFAKGGLKASGIQHKDGTGGAGQVVESYIYRGPDWQVGDQVVKAGDWMLGAIWDEPTWESIQKGALTGWSIQGFAKKSA